ncbi:major facilitator superfamily domain-containing protein [Xylariaceae sp. FL0255]|nr:major facilitator superfamily domain-containing protein [Xylariaceae sp. FL0255]
MTPQSLREGDKPPFPAKQLTILAICRFSEPIAFNSILAYTYVMVQDLHGGDATDASFYAGLLVSAYAVAEALTAVGWGILSDRYGRKPIVLFGLVGVAISSLIFGLAKSYWVALLARFVGGALNGNVAVMQTMVAEMVQLPEHEPAAYATQPFVWNLGGIIGSAMGGFLAQPATFYPSLFPKDGLFGRYPYLLPNLVSVIIIVLAVVQGMLFLEETNPQGTLYRDKDGEVETLARMNGEDEAIDDGEPDEITPLVRTRSNATQRSANRRASVVSFEGRFLLEESMPMPFAVEQSIDLRRTSFGTMHSIKLPSDLQKPYRLSQSGAVAVLEEECGSGSGSGSTREDEIEEEYTDPVYNKSVIMVTIAIVIVAWHQMAGCTLLPTQMLDLPRAPRGHLDLKGGLGFTIHDVGVFLAVNGFIGLFIQALIFPIFVNKVGVWHSLIWMTILYPTCYIILPFISALPEVWQQSAGVYLSMILQSLFGIIVSPCALILLKNATPSPAVLGRVNGLAMSACCLARTISPPLLGIVYSNAGSGAAWFSTAGVAVLGAVQLLWIPREHVHDVDDLVVENGPLVKTISGSDSVVEVVIEE